MLLTPLQSIATKKTVLTAVLLFMVVISALAVSYSAFENRRLHNVLQKMRQERNQAQVEWGRLLLEYSTLTSPGRVEQIAREQLNMKVPGAENIEMVMQ
ncbi:cell division protein FtsL [Candidatus Sororendozoicomonas aggregata]|uniref:cell division protein FtsL n=1 Tax=Candidatus Sororendozoicomonas aggregata TaxID=3073239 RepID=UPI002ED46EA2